MHNLNIVDVPEVTTTAGGKASVLARTGLHARARHRDRRIGWPPPGFSARIPAPPPPDRTP